MLAFCDRTAYMQGHQFLPFVSEPQAVTLSHNHISNVKCQRHTDLIKSSHDTNFRHQFGTTSLEFLG